MKLTIGDYEVSISARYTPASRKANKEDTQAVLNSIALWAGEASYRMEQNHCFAIAKWAIESRNDIVRVLEAQGYYDKK